MDLLHHLRNLWIFHHIKTWSQVIQGVLLRSSCDYILGEDRQQFKIMGIRDVRNYSSNNFALQARLLQRPTQYHSTYLWGRRAFPLCLPEPEDFRPTDRKFQELKALDPTLTPLTFPPLPQCML